ncbi:hypothetical protein [Sphingopyxis sp.]|uniref:hypothetical protein n=1 Tax=Sphingopyxis sp. TaxID=1908224 RepID=UPI003F72B47B
MTTLNIATGIGPELVCTGKLIKGKMLYFELCDGRPLAIHLLRRTGYISGQRSVARIRPTYDKPGISIDELGGVVLKLDPVAVTAIGLRFSIEYSRPSIAAAKCRELFDGVDPDPYFRVAMMMIDSSGPWIDQDDFKARYHLSAARDSRLSRH